MNLNDFMLSTTISWSAQWRWKLNISMPISSWKINPVFSEFDTARNYQIFKSTNSLCTCYRQSPKLCAVHIVQRFFFVPTAKCTGHFIFELILNCNSLRLFWKPSTFKRTHIFSFDRLSFLTYIHWSTQLSNLVNLYELYESIMRVIPLIFFSTQEDNLTFVDSIPFNYIDKTKSQARIKSVTIGII